MSEIKKPLSRYERSGFTLFPRPAPKRSGMALALETPPKTPPFDPAFRRAADRAEFLLSKGKGRRNRIILSAAA